jgi:hypothetical protein
MGRTIKHYCYLILPSTNRFERFHQNAAGSQDPAAFFFMGIPERNHSKSVKRVKIELQAACPCIFNALTRRVEALNCTFNALPRRVEALNCIDNALSRRVEELNCIFNALPRRVEALNCTFNALPRCVEALNCIDNALPRRVEALNSELLIRP